LWDRWVWRGGAGTCVVAAARGAGEGLHEGGGGVGRSEGGTHGPREAEDHRQAAAPHPDRRRRRLRGRGGGDPTGEGGGLPDAVVPGRVGADIRSVANPVSEIYDEDDAVLVVAASLRFYRLHFSSLACGWSHQVRQIEVHTASVLQACPCIRWWRWGGATGLAFLVFLVELSQAAGGSWVAGGRTSGGGRWGRAGAAAGLGAASQMRQSWGGDCTKQNNHDP